jgi:hypothetical protein
MILGGVFNRESSVGYVAEQEDCSALSKLACKRHTRTMAHPRRRSEAPTYLFPRGLGSASEAYCPARLGPGGAVLAGQCHRQHHCHAKWNNARGTCRGTGGLGRARDFSDPMIDQDQIVSWHGGRHNPPPIRSPPQCNRVTTVTTTAGSEARSIRRNRRSHG